jgi:hypothetical protein
MLHFRQIPKQLSYSQEHCSTNVYSARKGLDTVEVLQGSFSHVQSKPHSLNSVQTLESKHSMQQSLHYPEKLM